MTYNEILNEIKEAILALLIKLGIFVIPAMPASFLAYAVYSNYQDKSPDIGFWFAVVTATAFVVIGIAGASLALKIIDAWQSRLVHGWKAVVAGGMIPATALVGAVVIYMSEGAFPPVIRALGVAGEFLAMFMYILIGLDSSVDYAVEQKRVEKAERVSRKSGGNSTQLSSLRVENSTLPVEIPPVSSGIPLENSTFKVEKLEIIMEKYGVKKSRAYEIRGEQKAGRWNGNEYNG